MTKETFVEIEMPEEDPPLEYSPTLLADYMAKAIPVGKPSFRGNSSEGEIRRYFEINPSHIVDRSTPFGKQAWIDMVMHHLFPGTNPSIVIFEQFYNCEFANLEEYSDLHIGEDAPYAPNFFGMLVVGYLNARGFFYLDHEEKLKGPDGTLYDGVLIVASW